MSTSIPDSSVNPSPLIPATISSCARRRSADRPFATRRRGEWSVSARYSWPSARAASTIRSIDVRPSDHSLWLCRSPLSIPRRADDRSTPARSRRSTRYPGHAPRQRLLDHGERRIADALSPAQSRGIPQFLVARARRSRRLPCGTPSTCSATSARAPAGSRSRSARHGDARSHPRARASRHPRPLDHDRRARQTMDGPAEQDRQDADPHREGRDAERHDRGEQ